MGAVGEGLRGRWGGGEGGRGRGLLKSGAGRRSDEGGGGVGAV